MVPNYMARVFGPNWRTTFVGILTSFFSFVAFSPELFPHWLVQLSKFAMTGGLAALGLLTRDSHNHETPLPAGSTITQVKETTQVVSVPSEPSSS